MSTSRRGFLKGVLGTGAVGAAATALPGCAPDIDPAPVTDVTPDAEGSISLLVTRYPDLEPVGGAMTLRIPGRKPLLVVHRAEGTAEDFSVVDSTCTHKGCPLGYDGQDVVCPCHAARFDAQTGAALQRPAVVGLQKVTQENVSFNPGTRVLTITFGDAGFPTAVNGTVTLPFSQFPELRNNGSQVSGAPRGYGQTIIVSRQNDGTLAAVDALCTHQQCTVEPGQDRLVCPCHDANFALDGTMILGPITGSGGTRGTTPPLKKFTVTETPDAVVVTGVQ